MQPCWFQDEASKLRGKTVKGNTKAGYFSSIGQLIRFLYNSNSGDQSLNYRRLLNAGFMDDIVDQDGNCTQRKIIEKLHTLDPTNDYPPFDLQDFNICQATH